jgi:hypothetical protein
VVARPEADALRYLEYSDRPGGVLTTPLLGGVVPPYTGRSTWVGHRSWTPDFSARGRQADALFAGRMPPSAARALVRGTHASFVLSPCGARFDAAAVLGPSIASARRFGCAAVYALGR